MTIEELLGIARERGASDVHVTVGVPPILRVHGELEYLPYDIMVPDVTKALIYPTMTEDYRLQFEEKGEVQVPTAWKGGGANPIVVFMGGENDPRHYYFGGKGGRGTVNHGNMDGGSFIFELNGVRWVVDPGNQNYNDLEKTGFDLWNKKQNSDRWTLLTKNNFGHSTISVNNQMKPLHRAFRQG